MIKFTRQDGAKMYQRATGSIRADVNETTEAQLGHNKQLDSQADEDDSTSAPEFETERFGYRVPGGQSRSIRKVWIPQRFVVCSKL